MVETENEDPKAAAETEEAVESRFETALRKFFRSLQQPACQVLKVEEEVRLTRRLVEHKAECVVKLKRLASKRNARRRNPLTGKLIEDEMDPRDRALLRKAREAADGLKPKDRLAALVVLIESKSLRGYFSLCGMIEAVRDFDKMFTANLRLVVNMSSVVARRNHRIPLEDLIQYGAIGLMVAVARFDPALGYRFSTYSMHWIRSLHNRYINNNERLIRIPVHLVDLVNQVRGIGNRMNFDDPVGEEAIRAAARQLAPGSGSTVRLEAQLAHKVKLTHMALATPASLDAGPADGSEEPSNLHRTLADRTIVGPEEEIVQKARAKQLLDAVNGALKAKERIVILMRFGLADDRPQTLAEIGVQLALSRERIRQLEASALKKLKKRLININDDIIR